jgi:hypothetical protein
MRNRIAYAERYLDSGTVASREAEPPVRSWASRWHALYKLMAYKDDTRWLSVGGVRCHRA